MRIPETEDQSECPNCGGSGTEKVCCPECGGNPCEYQDSDGQGAGCPECDGAGWTEIDCPICGGSGER